MPLILVFAAVLLVQLGYLMVLRVGFRRALHNFDRVANARGTLLPAISVIVAARNEEGNLPPLLQALADQTHPEYEVLIVDDASTDRTREIIRAWQQSHPSMRLVEVDEPREPRKKHALTLGIGAASNDLLAFTDADCVPPPHWLEDAAATMAGAADEQLLVGYSPFLKERGLLNHFSRYETFLTGYLTAAAIGLGRPYMAVGRNMFYSKALFRRTGGFEATMESLSGDDDLFIQQVRSKRSGRILHLFSPRTFVPTRAPATWRQWFWQKIRHTSAGRFYPRDVKLHLTLYHATSTLIWIAPLVVGWWGGLILGIRLVVQGVFLVEGARHLREDQIYPAQPLLEFLYAAYNMFIAPLGLIRMPSRW